MSDKITGHCGGFLCSYADGQRVIEVGFISESGDLVTVPRDVFDRATAWIQERESPPVPIIADPKPGSKWGKGT
jgi:hypothetical protein